jgi:hypothetical protein
LIDPDPKERCEGEAFSRRTDGKGKAPESPVLSSGMFSSKREDGKALPLDVSEGATPRLT